MQKSTLHCHLLSIVLECPHSKRWEFNRPTVPWCRPVVVVWNMTQIITSTINFMNTNTLTTASSFSPSAFQDCPRTSVLMVLMNLIVFSRPSMEPRNLSASVVHWGQCWVCASLYGGGRTAEYGLQHQNIIMTAMSSSIALQTTTVRPQIAVSPVKVKEY